MPIEISTPVPEQVSVSILDAPRPIQISIPVPKQATVSGVGLPGPPGTPGAQGSPLTGYDSSGNPFPVTMLTAPDCVVYEDLGNGECALHLMYNTDQFWEDPNESGELRLTTPAHIMTQAEYGAITPDPQALYVIIG